MGQMLTQWIRVFYSDNGALTDYSIAAQNQDNIPFGVIAAEDYLYVGQYYPFNNVYFEVKTVNALASVVSVQYWNGKEWVQAKDILDGTAIAGKSLARSGVIQYSPDRQESWNMTGDTTDNGEPPELSSLEIYDLYWMRFKWSADLTPSCELKNVSYSFCTNEMLSSIDPEVNNYLQAWGGISKVNWNEQILLASQHVLYDLKSKGLVVGVGNILRFDDVSLATAYRTLGTIYGPLGEPFRTKFQDAINAYTELLSIKRFTLDVNEDGRVERGEITSSTGRLVR